jgi:hypothetical protein
MKHKIEVVVLPTKDNSDIGIHVEKGLVHKSDIHPIMNYLVNQSYMKCQHLYVTVPQDVELIKEGDLGIDLKNNHIFQATYMDANNINSTDPAYNKYKSCRKIITTTDRNLKTTISPYLFENGNACKSKDFYMAQPQQSFLKEYVANPDGDYEVEYEHQQNKLFHTGKSNYQLKLNQDNEVNITSVIDNIDWKDIANKLARVALEARDMLPHITMTTAKLHNLDLTLADRIEEELKPWLIEE